MKKRLTGLGALLLISLAFAASSAFSAPADPTAVPEKNPETVLAKVEKEEIKEKDINQVIQMMGPQGLMMDTPEGRQAILDELVAARLFALSGKKQELDQTPAFKEDLEKFSGQALARAAIEKLLNTVPAPSEDDVKKFYDENPDQFVTPEEIHARHILISDDVTSADTINLIQDELKKGVSFDVLAMEHSTCPSAPQGGDLGVFQKGQMVPEFEAAAFALENPGDVSEPVKTMFGWHIIKLEEKKPSGHISYDVVKPQILQYLTNERKAAKYQEELENLKKQYKVELLLPEKQAETPASPDAK